MHCVSGITIYSILIIHEKFVCNNCNILGTITSIVLNSTIVGVVKYKMKQKIR